MLEQKYENMNSYLPTQYIVFICKEMLTQC